MSGDRLDKIEDKLSSFDKKFEQLADAILKMALVEERISAAIELNKESKDMAKHNNNRIQVLERKAERSAIFERITWIIMTIAIGGYFAGKLFVYGKIA